MVILLLSCDKNEDLWQPFHILIEKYYPNHPEIIYATETLKNPYYKTISKNYPLELWTKRIRDTLKEIDDDLILLMVDDIFIRKPVDTQRIDYLEKNFKGACINFEKSFDSSDTNTDLEGIKKRSKGSLWELSIMCGLWDKKALMRVMNCEKTPWGLEETYKNTKYDFYINSGDYIIDWGYRYGHYAGIQKGKWCLEAKEFFDNEGIEIDYGKRGIVDNNTLLQ